MKIGVPKEIKNHEYRVGVTPDGARALTTAGHSVQVQSRAGERVGFADVQYQAAGATIVATPQEVYACDMVIKVKELQASEFALQRPDLILYCYQHFAPDAALLDAALASGVTGIAYETVTAPDGSLPLLTPMSAIAGRLAPQAGAWALQMANGGSGVLLAGVPGVLPARVLIVGGGVVGTNAARIALGMGAEVTLLDRSAARLASLDDLFGARLKTALSTTDTLERLVADADLVIGAVLLPGKLAPKLVHRADVQRMRPGSVIVDVAIDQGRHLRNVARDLPHGSHLCRQRRHSLLRAQHAVGGGAHRHACADAGDAAAGARDREQGPAARAGGQSRTEQRRADVSGQGHARGPRAGHGARLYRARLAAALMPAGDAGDLRARIDALLPQTQCGQCGYAGCSPYAQAIAEGAADINRCPPGGDGVIDDLARLLSRAPTPLDPACGVTQAPAVALIDESWCIGCTLCIQACPVDAIVGAAKVMHTVITAECTGCALCIAPCPVDCIRMVAVERSDARSERIARADHWRRRYLARERRLAANAARSRAQTRSVATSPTERRQAAVERALERARERIIKTV